MTNNETFEAEARALWDAERTGPYARAGGDFLGFLPLSTFSNVTSALLDEASAQDPSEFLAPGTPSEVIEGYRAMHAVLAERMSAPDSALVEATWSDGRIGMSLQAPFSRGSVQVNSTSMMDMPLIDARVLHNPLDRAFLVEAIKFARTIAQTDAIAPLSPVEASPGRNITSDEDLVGFVSETGGPAWHLGGTCRMGPREHGGVVDEQLKVFGVANLRVVDASVMPLLPASHPMATVYAVAEMVRISL